MYYMETFQVMNEELIGIASDFGLVFLGTRSAGEAFVKKHQINKIINKENKIFQELNEWLDAYEKQEPRPRLFKLELMQEVTIFQKEVWRAMEEIPYGASCSYQDIAKKIKNPRAVQAVGTAIGKNPWLLLVPCHRVLRKTDEIGGFSAGLDLKRKLLAHEKINFVENISD